MFTGIVEEIGTLERVEQRGNLSRLWFRGATVLSDARLGDSIAHNGVCLTIAELKPPLYGCDVMAETLRVTTLGALRAGSRVNLERAMAAGGRFGGHIVQGHVDGVGTIERIDRLDQWIVYRLSAPDTVQPYVVRKGSVTIDGISLTVVDADAEGFTVSLIPHTLGVTTLGERKVGDRVNLEADVLARYVVATLARLSGRSADESAATSPQAGSGMTWTWLAEHGFG
ncbi:MAG: riboflavin synthase [Armatimonadetes bacterium]|nr:riboflavin synthase [Armatimonadota bacterium]